MKRKIAVFGAQKNLEQFIKRAVLLGYELYGFASGDNNPCVKYFKEFYNISFTETDEIIGICKEKGIEGVTSFSLESALPYVIKVSQALGTTSNSVHHSELINDKYVMRQLMQKFGVNIPKYIETDNFKNLSSADLNGLGYPVIVKPIDGGGSRGVTKVTTEEDLASAIEYAKQCSRKKIVIVEQFISGREFSVEYISHKGCHYFLTITDKVTESEHFIEIQHHQPADIPFAVAQKIREQVEKTLNALEITDSPSHTEVMLHNDGEIYVIECGPRMGGDNIQASLVRLSTGYDLVEGALELCSNHFVAPVFNNQKCAGIYFILPGTEYVADWLQKHQNDSRIIESEYRGYISTNVQNNGERDGFFIYQADEKLVIEKKVTMTLEQSIIKQPLVAINCMVYNHEPYLCECLDGFVMQKTTFPVVAFVHDDCSTDGSAKIIAEYAEKYPDLICPMYEKENQYQYGHRTARIVEKACVESGAKYIAECEGDDYWTDALKLQKQVDFMEKHPDYSACWHNFSYFNCSTGKISPARPQKVEMDSEDGADVTVERYLWGKCGGQPLSLLYRVSMYDFNCRDKYKYFRDVHHAILLLKAGKGRFMNFYGATYHAHSDSATNCICSEQFADLTCKIIAELYQSFPDDKALSNYLTDVLVWNYKHHHLKNTLSEFWSTWKETLKIAPSSAIQAFYIILKRRIRHII